MGIIAIIGIIMGIIVGIIAIIGIIVGIAPLVLPHWYCPTGIAMAMGIPPLVLLWPLAPTTEDGTYNGGR